jgi:hypothetical protein
VRPDNGAQPAHFAWDCCFATAASFSNRKGKPVPSSVHLADCERSSQLTLEDNHLRHLRSACPFDGTVSPSRPTAPPHQDANKKSLTGRCPPSLPRLRHPPTPSTLSMQQHEHTQLGCDLTFGQFPLRKGIGVSASHRVQKGQPGNCYFRWLCRTTAVGPGRRPLSFWPPQNRLWSFLGLPTFGPHPPSCGLNFQPAKNTQDDYPYLCRSTPIFGWRRP